mmetsp:Transcript_109087/g.260292  ORF Transcript_109087/g.260292 Transcript_109087/m.260292 type:complete len:112 (-) Transcript_109087:69-404(-)
MQKDVFCGDRLSRHSAAGRIWTKSVKSQRMCRHRQQSEPKPGHRHQQRLLQAPLQLRHNKVGDRKRLLKKKDEESYPPPAKLGLQTHRFPHKTKNVAFVASAVEVCEMFHV